MQSSDTSNKFGWKIGLLLIICVIAIAYTVLSKEEPPPAPSLQEIRLAAAIANFDPRVLSCNDVVTGEPSEALETCNEVAKTGSLSARHRLIWAYSRANDHQNWQKVFDLLKSLPKSDRNAQLLRNSLLHLMGDTPELKMEGEEEIKKLAVKNYAPANVILASIYALGQNTLPQSSDVLWLLRRAALADPAVMDPTKLALIYANTLEGQRGIEEGSELLAEVAEQHYPEMTNNVAWFLATLDNNPFHSTEYAIELANRVVSNQEHENNPIYIDTLAAGYASHGNIDTAIETQEKAIAAIQTFDWSEEVKKNVLEQYSKHLEIYQQGKQVVEYKLTISVEDVFKDIKLAAFDTLFRQYFRTITDPNTIELKSTKDQKTDS